MKNLLYIAAFALALTSCSVDSLQDENSILLDEIISKGPVYNNGCNEVKLSNLNGESRGTIIPFVDYHKKVVIIQFTTIDWKINTSKVYIGTKNGLDSDKPGLFESGKYQYFETFENNVYTASYVFAINDIKSDFGISAHLNITNDTQSEAVFSLAKGSQNYDDNFIESFLKECF
ncbi:MAG: hypothetical protein KJO41_02230 [Bacteroidia bacterium]|nr:hypothetical protein [Bacteroidia bacterium]MBT8277791.1 hypothetical protein [Bacteroidia bacterium]NND26916.1 hypothetical protein [Flavobacteriaceae bacterium]NNK61193.1 hypothetical protein [Flavobacteriaceae bacterium]NNL31782.1 hypothetical protein [Flavobacteriaceae bacterium]